jgi:riboflavin kinase/FMN adenylyltransferase
MKKFFSLDHLTIDKEKGCVVSIGMFDGIHIGHQQVINTCIATAKSSNLKSVIITFSNHPAEYFTNAKDINLLTNVNEKIALLASYNLDYLIILPFDYAISQLSANEFVHSILISKLNCKTLVFGYDNHFGKNREGSQKYIDSEFSELITTVVVYEKKIDSEIISSSRIKSLLENGDIQLSNECLGYSYSISSKIIHGNALGRTLGFPTANFSLENLKKVIPATGVYITRSKIYTPGGEYERYGLTNVGYRPTVTEEKILSVETYLLDFDLDIYGCEMTTSFIKKQRNELKFSSLDELKNQIENDKKEAKEYLTKIHVAS